MLKHDYRKILKYINQLPSSNQSHQNNINMKTTVINLFRNGKKESDEKKVTLLREKAQSYATLITSINTLSYLRSLDSGEKELSQKERVNVSAARVGLGVPNLYNETKMD